MDKQQAFSPIEAKSVREMNQRKSWLADGAIQLAGYSVDHTIQPQDSIQLPAFSEHLLTHTFTSGNRQFSQFAGQTSDKACHKDHTFIVPAGTPSRFAWEQTDEALNFGINPDTLRETAIRTESLLPSRVELKPIVLGYDEQLTRIAHCLRHEIQTEGAGGRLFNESLLTCLSIHLLRRYCVFEPRFRRATGGLAPYKLNQAIAHIEANLANDNISLTTLSQLADLSPAYFVRQFKQSTGYSPHQYVIRQRIEKSKRLLKQRQLPIAEIAIECGFSSQSHFYGAFRKVVGTTPKRYQDSL